MSKQKAQRLADAPERIWLQVCDDADCVESFAEHDGVTWCQHRIHDSDIEYVRAERIAALEAALEQARVALDGIVSFMDGPEKAAYKDRMVLRDLLTHEQRGDGINKARAALCAIEKVQHGR